MISAIKSPSLFILKISLGSSRYDVISITIKLICCEQNVIFEPTIFIEEKSTLKNAFVQGLEIIHVGLEMIALSVNMFMLNLNSCIQIGAVMIQSIMEQYDKNRK